MMWWCFFILFLVLTLLISGVVLVVYVAGGTIDNTVLMFAGPGIVAGIWFTYNAYGRARGRFI